MKLVSLIDSKRKKTLLTKFAKVKCVLGVVLYVCGVLGFGALVHKDISPRNYVDENALMPGYVASEFSQTNTAQVTKLAEELTSMGLQRMK
jgi:hypothetical protein